MTACNEGDKLTWSVKRERQQLGLEALRQQRPPNAKGQDVATAATNRRKPASAVSALLELQRLVGNSAVTALLETGGTADHQVPAHQDRHTAVQRAGPPASQLMTPATGSGSPVREHPVTEGPVEQEATGIEGTPVEAHLQTFLGAVDAEITAWQEYRHTFKAPIPGLAAYRAAEQIEAFLVEQRRSTEKPKTVDYGLGPMILLGAPSERYDHRVRPYLARHLGPEKLYLLREMTSFGRTPTGLAIGSVTLNELFNIKPIPLTHEYELRVTGNRGGMIGGGVGGGGYVRHFELHYHNNLGMSYVTEFSGASVAFFGGIGWEWKPGGKGGGGHHGPEREFSVEFEAEGTASDPVFWEPDDFAGDSFAVAKVGGTVSGEAGPVGGGVEGKLLEMITFYHSIHGSITFPLAVAKIEAAPITLKRNFKLELGAGAKAGIEVQGGMTWSGDKTAVHAPEVPAPERHETGEWRVLMEAQAFFRTGSADVSEEATETIAALLERVRGWKEKHCEYKLRFLVTGHASPRWANPTRGATPNALNLALSEHRATNTLEQIRNVFRNIGSGPVAYESQSNPGKEVPVDDPTAHAMVRAQGPFEALAEHRSPKDDWWHDRRVDIVVYRSEIGIVTEAPPDVRGSGAE